MPFSVNFSLKSLSQIGKRTIRVTYAMQPKASSTIAPNDALNPLNYAFAGPSSVNVDNVIPVRNDILSVDVTGDADFALGSWSLAVSNVQSVVGNPINPPTSLSFTVTSAQASGPVTLGTETDDAETALRKYLNPVLKGRGWDALVGALAVGEQVNWDNAKLAFDQLFISSASGKYLVQRAGDQGIQVPKNIGIPDYLFRQLAIRASTAKVTQQSLYDIMEIFYGIESVRAFTTSGNAEPFSLVAGDDILFELDGKDTYEKVFLANEFVDITAATAIEVCAGINRLLSSLGSYAFAIPYTDPITGLTKIRLYSASLGLGSKVKVTGGKAQNALQFPTLLSIYDNTGPFPDWDITFNSLTNRVRFSSTTSPTGLDLSNLIVGDYVNIYGSEFNTNNLGSFEVLEVSVIYPLEQYFEVENADGVTEGPITQLADDSILYFRPVLHTITNSSNRGVIIAQTQNEVSVVLPVTSQAVGRHEYTGSYLQTADSQEIEEMIRDIDGVVTVTSPAHGLSVGDQIYVDDAASSPTVIVPSLVRDLTGPPYLTPGYPVNIVSQLADMSFGHPNGTATLLQNGDILVVGGEDPTDQCELFTITNTITSSGLTQYEYDWLAAADYFYGAVADHRAGLITGTTLTGFVLVSGGSLAGITTANCALYDPGLDSWTATGAMSVPRQNHGLCEILGTGVFLATDGYDSTFPGVYDTAEVYDPTSVNWFPVVSMSTTRQLHCQVALNDNDILVAGGENDSGLVLNTCEIYDALANSWSKTGNMQYAREEAPAIRIPDGRIIVIGGRGFDPSVSVIAVALDTIEVYDPNVGMWNTLGKRMAVPRIDACAQYCSENNCIVISGGAANAPMEFIDCNTLKLISSNYFPYSEYPIANTTFSAILDNGSILMLGGGATPALFPPFLYMPGDFGFMSGGLNGPQTVETIINADEFTYITPGGTYDVVTDPALFTPMAAPEGEIAGPFIWDTKGGVGITDFFSDITQDIYKSQQYESVTVTDGTDFPDEEGYLVFQFGYEDQVGPVKYLGKVSLNELILDYSFVFPKDIPSGSSVCLLYQRGIFVPESPEEVGSFYMTDSPSGRVAASQAIDDYVALGEDVNKTILYPSDRGLGNEGYPVESNYKVSDIVQVFAGSDIDQELAVAREGDDD